MSKKRTIHGIDPYAAGGIEALLAHHRQTFGDAVMEAGDPAPAAEPSPAGDPAPAGAPAPEDPKPADPAPEPQKVEELPAWAQKIISDARKEAGDARTDRAAAKTLEAIQKTLNPDAAKGDKPTPEALTKALTDRETEARQAKTELAVYKAASKHGADADALLDSRGFLAKLKDIDPSDAKAIDKAIKDAVTDNPKLKAVLAASASGANFGGPGESHGTAASKAKPGQSRIAAAYATK